MDGESLYQEACAACHGVDGQGAAPSALAFEEAMPDFTDCSFATREPDGDWIAVGHQGGPTRGFSRMMPAFGEALGEAELQRVMDYVRTLCDEPAWPRGELNFPRAMFTEKAYPEDELVWTVDAWNEEGGRSVLHEVVYEKRLGARSQVELVVPFGMRRRDAPDGNRGGWRGGLGDLVLGVKHAVFHSLERGSILSGGAEVKLPTGTPDEGFGGGATVLESFVSFGQMLPADGFLQLQGILEFPTDRDLSDELVARAALGRTFTQGRWGRAWSPMVEVLGARELDAGEDWSWDLAPQIQVTLNTRQHVIANVAVRVPLTDRDARDPRLYIYLLWDWFDGGLLEGW
ncbi:MAG: c-type cytochrome [bacterium]